MEWDGFHLDIAAFFGLDLLYNIPGLPEHATQTSVKTGFNIGMGYSF